MVDSEVGTGTSWTLQAFGHTVIICYDSSLEAVHSQKARDVVQT